MRSPDFGHQRSLWWRMCVGVLSATVVDLLQIQRPYGSAQQTLIHWILLQQLPNYWYQAAWGYFVITLSYVTTELKSVPIYIQRVMPLLDICNVHVSCPMLSVGSKHWPPFQNYSFAFIVMTSFNCSLRSFLLILPVAVRGMAATVTKWSGIHHDAILPCEHRGYPSDVHLQVRINLNVSQIESIISHCINRVQINLWRLGISSGTHTLVDGWVANIRVSLKGNPTH